MKTIFPIILLATIALSCSNHSTIENDQVENIETLTSDTLNNSTSNTTALPFNYTFFEKVENTWEYPSSNPILTEYGFAFKSLDTTDFDQYTAVHAVFSNPITKDQIEISDNKYDNGEIIFNIKYTTTKKLHFDSIQETLTASESLYIKKDEQFEKFGLGSYEDKIFTHSEIIDNDERRYIIKYSHRTGKELMAAPMLEE